MGGKDNRCIVFPSVRGEVEMITSNGRGHILPANRCRWCSVPLITGTIENLNNVAVVVAAESDQMIPVPHCT